MTGSTQRQFGSYFRPEALLPNQYREMSTLTLGTQGQPTAKAVTYRPTKEGFRVFEIWVKQRYGKKQDNLLHAGNIDPWMNFNRTILKSIIWQSSNPAHYSTKHSAPCSTIRADGFREQHNIKVLLGVAF